MDKKVICAALAQHFGHRDWTLIGTDKVQLDGSDDIIEIATLNIEAIISEWDQKAKTLEINAEARRYLAETDWYIIRNQESGTEIPADILVKRQAARNLVVAVEG